MGNKEKKIIMKVWKNKIKDQKLITIPKDKGKRKMSDFIKYCKNIVNLAEMQMEGIQKK